MAIFRSIYTTFWKDTKIVDDFTPEDKYFMLYCLTNDYTNLCGCFEISINQIALDMGYNKETIEKLLDRFENVHKIVFYNRRNKEMLIKNWHKYNWTKSNKLDKPLLESIKKIKTEEFKRILTEEYNKRDTVSIPYIYTMDTTVADTVSNTIYINNNNNIKNITKYYEENIGMLNPASAEILFSYLDDFSEEIIIEAIKRASINNKKSCSYIKGILNNWLNKGFKTLADIENEKSPVQLKEQEKEKIIDLYEN